ncbi:MAG TPA: hypothetical protein VNJ04_06220 [Gemmatimonadaceae bacterium]|nr:hypothetical protein [Gemmatimonadaceae bacterium]
MLHPDPLGLEDYADDVEAKGVAGLLEARDPDSRRAGELALFAPANGADRAAEAVAGAGLYLYEGYFSLGLGSGSCCDEVDVAMAAAEAVLGDGPAVDAEPAGGYALALFAFCLGSCGHVREVRGEARGGHIVSVRVGVNDGN